MNGDQQLLRTKSKGEKGQSVDYAYKSFVSLYAFYNVRVLRVFSNNRAGATRKK